MWSDDDYAISSPETSDAKAIASQTRIALEYRRAERLAQNVTGTDLKKWATAIAFHRHRQLKFYASCAKALKATGASWIVLIDTDEFITAGNPPMVGGASGTIAGYLNEPIPDTGTVAAAFDSTWGYTK